MKLTHALLLAVPVAALALTNTRDAAACGGCFVPPDESTQVTGHRMVLSVSKTETTLWDQISYSGTPRRSRGSCPPRASWTSSSRPTRSSRSWGKRRRRPSSRLRSTAPGPPDGCYFGGEDGGSATAGSGGSSAGGGVTVVAQETVGPYETVQLKSDDPAALKNWLADHNFTVPADVQPVLDAYVADHFDFVALKLVPGRASTPCARSA